MMTLDEFRLLCDPAVRRAVEQQLGRDPLEVALDAHLPHARTVATQVKYLQRAAVKLPTYRAAGCIIPALAFEQSSSEACARRKRMEGGSVLDLTCGLGVDAFFLAQRFQRVVALERDEVLAAVARENFIRLGAPNIEVVHASAEEYLAACRERFDWVYADPDRRSAEGRKQLLIEACSPDMRALDERIRRVGDRLCMKLSPLFDVDEALRLYPAARIEVVSLGGECKEVVVCDDGTGPCLTAEAIGLGNYSLPAVQARETVDPGPFRAAEYRWLVAPDVALQKARLACRHLLGRAWIGSDNGFGFAAGRPDGVLGRIFAIEGIEPFDPGALRKEWKGVRCGFLRRDFPLSSERIAAQTGMREGGPVRLAFTQAEHRLWTVRLKRDEQGG